MISRNYYINQFFKILAFYLLFLVLCSIQTIWWTQIFGSIPAPQLWLTLIVFLILKWPLYRGIFFTYFLGFNLIFYSHSPLKMIWICLNLIYILLWTVKNRINSTSLVLFGSLCSMASLLYSLLYFLTSRAIEPVPTQLFFIHRLTVCGLTFLFSLPLYFVYTAIEDFFTIQEKWKSQGSTSTENQEHLL